MDRKEASRGASDATLVVCPHCGKRNRLPVAARGVAKCGSCHLPLPWLVEANDLDFTDVAERATLPVVVEFWAPWCGPCRMVAPVLEQLARDYAGHLKVVKVNVDESPRVAERFRVMSIPMLLLIRRGAVVDQTVGAQPLGSLTAWVAGNLENGDLESSEGA